MFHNLDNAISAFLMSKAGMVTLSAAIVILFIGLLVAAIQ